MTTRKITALVLVVIVALTIAGLCSEGWYYQDANEIVVTQSAFNGAIDASFSAGPHTRLFAKITRYPRRGQIEFTTNAPDDSPEGELFIPDLHIRFNDGAEATMSGSIAWEMPLSAQQVTNLYTLYPSASAIESQIIAKNLQKAAFNTGPLMTSAESYATKRNDLLSLIQDQVENGAYKTTSTDITTRDTLTGDIKVVRQVSIVLNTNGTDAREDDSLIAGLGLHTFNLAIVNVTYPDSVEKQIQTQQENTMAVQTGIAKAKTAEQDALTIEQTGKASAAKAKWDQEAIKAQAVTEAEQKVEVMALNALATKTNAVIQAQQLYEVAELAAKTALQSKAAAISLGEGDAAAAKLRMAANGALEQKLAAWQAVNLAYAQAIATYKGNWVPTTVVGGGGSGNSQNGADSLIELLRVKTARDLSLDTSITVPAESK